MGCAFENLILFGVRLRRMGIVEKVPLRMFLWISTNLGGRRQIKTWVGA